MPQIMTKYQEVEYQKMKAVVLKRGVDVIVSPIVDNVPDIADLDIDDSFIEVIDNFKSSNKETFGVDYNSKLYITSRDNLDLREDKNDNNIIGKTTALLLDDETLKEGTLIAIIDTDIRYKVVRMTKKNSFSLIKILELIKA